MKKKLFIYYLFNYLRISFIYEIIKEISKHLFENIPSIFKYLKEFILVKITN